MKENNFRVIFGQIIQGFFLVINLFVISIVASKLLCLKLCNSLYQKHEKCTLTKEALSRRYI